MLSVEEIPDRQRIGSYTKHKGEKQNKGSQNKMERWQGQTTSRGVSREVFVLYKTINTCQL